MAKMGHWKRAHISKGLLLSVRSFIQPKNIKQTKKRGYCQSKSTCWHFAFANTTGPPRSNFHWVRGAVLSSLRFPHPNIGICMQTHLFEAHKHLWFIYGTHVCWHWQVAVIWRWHILLGTYLRMQLSYLDKIPMSVLTYTYNNFGIINWHCQIWHY